MVASVNLDIPSLILLSSCCQIIKNSKLWDTADQDNTMFIDCQLTKGLYEENYHFVVKVMSFWLKWKLSFWNFKEISLSLYSFMLSTLENQKIRGKKTHISVKYACCSLVFNISLYICQCLILWWDTMSDSFTAPYLTSLIYLPEDLNAPKC